MPSNNFFAKNLIPSPGVFSCYSHGWRQMWRYFLELLLILIVSFIFSLPSLGLYYEKLGKIISDVVKIDLLFISFEGLGAYIVFAILYVILFEWPLEYGISYAFLKASRNENLQVKNMFAFFKNYSNSIMANLLTSFIIIVGFIFFLIPGIIFSCKLAFVPYLIVDKKMDAVAAVKESWRMTGGYAIKIFLMGLLAFFIAIGGLIALGIGIIISIIWIKLAFAALYYSVDSDNEISDLTAKT